MKDSLESGKKLRPRKRPAFRVLWGLTGLAIIIFIAALILASSTVSGPGMRSWTNVEIQAMSTALEGYRTDHGSYPTATNLLTNYLGNDVTQNGGSYQMSSQTLYRALSGQTNFTDVPPVDSKAYFSFKRNQVGDAVGGSFVKDEWGNPFGYSTGNEKSYPYNGKGYFDLWSTGGSKGISAAQTNAWFSNWQ
jgi:hypothetical protein